MNITSKLIKIKKIAIKDTKTIEKEIKAQGIIPLRWAIVQITDNEAIINVAY